jgi:hypothetical protein
MHLMLEVFAASIAVVPIAALLLAFRRTRSSRVLLALIAFAVLEARLISMILIHTVLPVDHSVEELIDFGGDLAVIVAFAWAFLTGLRWLPDRTASKPA